MSAVHFTSLLLAAYLAPFVSARFDLGRSPVGAQVDFLPAILVFAALNCGLGGIALVAICGGLLFDAFSGNALGVSMISLLLAGKAVHHFRDLVLRDLPYAQCLLGGAVGAAVPAGSLLFQVGFGASPLVGWGTFWQLAFLAGTSAIVTPLFFLMFNRLERAFGYPRMNETSFRPDREIKRGRF